MLSGPGWRRPRFSGLRWVKPEIQSRRSRGRRVARKDGSGNVTYYFEEPVGRARTITGANGVACNEADYYLFGGEQSHGNTCDQNYHFAGMYRDGETGNDYTQFRMYESNLGRWMTPDPVAGDITNPQSLNRYAYVLNNPTNSTDPLGLKPDDANTVDVDSIIDSLFGGSFFGGGCFADGAPAPCSMVLAQVAAGAAVQCPGNICEGWASNGEGQIAYAQFHPTLENANNWQVVSPWIADPSLPQNQPGYLPAVQAQRDYAYRLLQQMVEENDPRLAAFKKANSDLLSLTVEGGNVHFNNVGFNFGCEHGRCDNGLDFSHGGGVTFHADTANPFNFPGGTIVHFAVDIIAGNFVYTVIPRH